MVSSFVEIFKPNLLHMKKSIISIMLLALTATSFCQENPSLPPMTRADYLSKSKTDKVFAFILLGAGITTIAIISGGNTNFNSLATFAILGTVCTLASIPLFISARKNKRKAMKISAYFKLEKIPLVQQQAICLHSLPSVSVKISLP